MVVLCPEGNVDFPIPMDGFIGWECAVCGICIASSKGRPSSEYWNVDRKEVYCSAEHSLQRHEEANDQ